MCESKWKSRKKCLNGIKGVNRIGVCEWRWSGWMEVDGVNGGEVCRIYRNGGGVGDNKVSVIRHTPNMHIHVQYNEYSIKGSEYTVYTSIFMN